MIEGGQGWWLLTSLSSSSSSNWRRRTAVTGGEEGGVLDWLPSSSGQVAVSEMQAGTLKDNMWCSGIPQGPHRRASPRVGKGKFPKSREAVMHLRLPNGGVLVMLTPLFRRHDVKCLLKDAGLMCTCLRARRRNGACAVLKSRG